MDTEIDGLKKVLAKTQPKKMHFARETKTYRKPYFVLVKDNNVYRYGAERNPVPGEVRMDFHGRNAVSLVPLRGHPVNDSSQIAKLFDNVDKSTLFVWLSSDTASFDALMKIKDHLRANGYQVFWEINPSYQFSYGEGAEYRAAD
jgi:hypothetical protein